MESSRLNPKHGKLGLAGPLVLVLALALIVSVGFASRAQAAPVQLTFDNGRMSLGFFSDRVILPADSAFPSPDLPAPQRTDIQLIGDQTGDQITFSAAANSGLQFPYFHMMHPIEPDLKIPMTFRLNAPGLTGTWDEASGAMTLNGNLDIIVVTGTGTNFPIPDSLTDLAVPPLGLFARCRYNDVPVSFSTATVSPISAQPFSGGFGVNGAMTTAWDSLAPAVSENGGECADLNQLTGSNGGIWLSNGVVEPQPQPPGPEPTCETDLSLCPPPTFTEIDGVRLKPGRKAVKAGKKLMLTVRVHNSGNIAARRLKVKIKSNNRRVKVPKVVTLTVPARGFASKKFAVRVKRKAKGRAVITAKSNGWTGRSYLKIKKKKKVRRR